MPLKRAAAAAVLVAIGACTFPAVTLVTEPSEGGTPEAGAEVADGSVDAAEAGGQQLPPDVDPDGGGADATVVPEGGARIDAGDAGCDAADPCDCDDDRTQRSAPPACAPAGTADCDDLDPFIKPNTDFVASPWDTASPHEPAFDWNCDGTVTKQYNYDAPCTLTNCNDGFAGNPGCGESATYNHCAPILSLAGLLTACSVGSTEARTQGCR